MIQNESDGGLAKGSFSFYVAFRMILIFSNFNLCVVDAALAKICLMDTGLYLLVSLVDYWSFSNTGTPYHTYRYLLTSYSE
jgi:hypothetical protein